MNGGSGKGGGRADRQTQRSASARASLLRGHDGEWRALALLTLKGWRLIARRYGGKGGEIDLIMRRGRVVIFVEVKARAEMGAALEAITAEKQRLMRRQAARWQAENPWAREHVLRVDGVFLGSGGWPRHVRDIFPLG
jgi:putative endonuclease